MQQATARLVQFSQQTGAKLIYGLTTAYMCSADTDGIISNTLNTAASAIMAAASIPVVDVHSAIIAKCGAVPQAQCFGETGCFCPHCPPGYSWLSSSVIAPAIRALLQ